EYDPVAALSLLPGRDHPGIILVRRYDFVSGFQIETELHDLERLARIARDRNLLGIAAERLREPPPARFDSRVENTPHVVSGIHILHFEITNLRIHHDPRSRRYTPVVQVDQRAIDRE